MKLIALTLVMGAVMIAGAILWANYYSLEHSRDERLAMKDAANAKGPITLLCTGDTTLYESNGLTKESSFADEKKDRYLVIDMERKEVTGNINGSPFRIYNITENGNLIHFSARWSEVPHGVIGGTLNRVTRLGEITGSSGVVAKPVWTLNISCERTDPLF